MPFLHLSNLSFDIELLIFYMNPSLSLFLNSYAYTVWSVKKLIVRQFSTPTKWPFIGRLRLFVYAEN